MVLICLGLWSGCGVFSQKPGPQPPKAQLARLPFQTEWVFQLKEGIQGISLLSEHVAVQTGSNKIYAFDRKSGTVRWIFISEEELPFEFPPVEIPSIAQEILLAKEIINERELEVQIEKRKDAPDTSLIRRLRSEQSHLQDKLNVLRKSDFTFLVSRYTLYCLDRETGILRWKRGLPFIPSAPPLATPLRIFIPAREFNRVYELDIDRQGFQTGFYTAQTEIADNTIGTSPIFYEPYIYFVSYNGNLYAYSIRDRMLKWTFKTYGAIKVEPILKLHSWVEERPSGLTKVELPILFVGSTDHAFYAINAKDGKLIWKYETGDIITRPPRVIDDMVYVTTQKGGILALNIRPLHLDKDGKELGPKRKGELRWRFTKGQQVLFKKEGLIYIIGKDKNLHLLREQNGELTESYPLTGFDFFVPDPKGKRLILGTRGGYVVLLR